MAKAPLKTVKKFDTAEKPSQILDEDQIEWAKVQVRKITEQEREEKREMNIRFQPEKYLEKTALL